MTALLSHRNGVPSLRFSFVIAWAIACLPLSAAARIVFQTGFETSEGYNSELTLVGQNGWLGEGTGGNGILKDPEFGQLAYVGAWPPTGQDDLLSVWKPINLAPISSTESLITFAVTMVISDSENNQYDDFRWSVYNAKGDRLFTLDFDNAALEISYALDDSAGFVPVGLGFDNEGAYDLVIQMNFARNLWTATLNEQVIVNSKRITTKGAALNLGDIDAVWAIRKPGSPGDNYMLFDNYTIHAENLSSIPSQIESRGFVPTGPFAGRVFGEQGLTYIIEASGDFKSWLPIQQITAPAGGVFDFQDPTASGKSQQFYRVRQQP
jgi:hypothetical protein